jgi:hypothetical protein
MVSQYERPYTSEELGRLQRWINQPPPGRLAWALGCTESILVYFLGFSTALITGVYLESVWKLPAGLSLSLLVAIALCFATIRLINRIRRRRLAGQWESAREELQRDIDDGKVAVICAKVLAAVKISPFDDFGWGWFLDLGDSRILYLYGDTLDDLRFDSEDRDDHDPQSIMDGEYEDFPNSEIEIVRTRSGRLIDVRCLGSFLGPSEPVADVMDSPESDVPYYLLPSQGHLFSGSLATLPADVNRELQTIAARDALTS